MQRIIAVFLIALSAYCLVEQTVAMDKPRRPVHTYSIVARDEVSGEIGVAVQSHWFSVGSGVLWAEPGVGAVATQSFTDPSYGPLGLKLMRAGRSAPQALSALLAADEYPAVRQVGMVDAAGQVANHTGNQAIAEACNQSGGGYSVQANLMWKKGVCAAMADAFQVTKGDLAARLMAALEAAQAVGGDMRGQQSAALLVVSGDIRQPPWGGRLFDLRVEDHSDPLGEMRRLVQLARAYRLMNQGDEHLTQQNIEGALEAYSAAEAMAPDYHEMTFWHAVTLAGNGRVEESLSLFKRAFAAWPLWRELVQRLPASGLLPEDAAMMQQIVEVQ